MAEQMRNTPSAAERRASLDIPWMRRWEKAAARDKAAPSEDRQSRLRRIDFMTMLSELEFH